jgi:hypothetical protein
VNLIVINFQIEELVTITKLKQSGSEPENALELQDRMAELQSEMFRLEVTNKKLSSMQNGSGDGVNAIRRISQTFTANGD